MFDAGFSDQFTPMYVAPEIIRKEGATALSDMYSLGVMMYLMFTGHLPFEVDNIQKLYMCHLHAPPIHPSLIEKKCPETLGDIIMRLLEKKPAKRFPNCDQLRIALAEIGKSRI
jgi:serine/threonine-protein kinase